MPFTFTQDQVNLLTSELDKAIDNEIPFSQVYDMVLEFISDYPFLPDGSPDLDNAIPSVDAQGNAPDGSVWLWLAGARKINANDGGVYSEFIRDYTSAQYSLRTGNTLGDTQPVSDAIARAVIEDIIANNQLPTIHQLAVHDANTTAASHFNNDKAVWSGNLLFLALGHEKSFYENILHRPDGVKTASPTSLDTYDLLAMYSSAAQAGYNFSTVFGTLLGDLNPGIFQTLGSNDIGFSLTTSLLIDAAAYSDIHLRAAYSNLLTLDMLIGETAIFTDVDDLYLGTLADDTLEVGDAFDDDLIHAGAGQDTIVATNGDDYLDGGEGYDWVDYRPFNDGLDNNITADLSTHTVTITDLPTNDHQKLFNIEALRTGDGVNDVTGSSADNIIMSGESNDTLRGQAGHDELQGGSGDDHLYGNSGSDLLYGEYGYDTLLGDAGNDVLIGGRKNDYLEGGDNSDIYWFGPWDGNDTIVDSHGADRIQLGSDKLVLEGEAEALDPSHAWDYVLRYGEDNNGDGELDQISYFDWTGDPLVAGSRGTLEIDFDATDIKDITILNYANGEFGITFEGAQLDPNAEEGEDPADINFTAIPRSFTEYAGIDGPTHSEGLPSDPEAGDGDVGIDGDPIDPPEGDGELTPLVDIGESIASDVVAPFATGSDYIQGDHISTRIDAAPGDSDYVPPALSVGDPHLLSFDGNFYDFQDSGEFILVRSTDENAPFEIQARQQEWDLGDAVGDMFSVNTAIATRLGDYKVGFYINGSLPYDQTAALADDNPLNDEEPVLYIEDYPVFMADNTVLHIEGVGSVYRNGDMYMVVNNTQDRLIVQIHDTHIDFSSALGDARSSGTLEGLLGNADGDATNDFTLGDGTDLGNDITSNVLYNVFGEDWRINQSESLFLYGEGQTTYSFDNPDFDDTQRTLADFDSALVAAAEAAAIAEGFDAASGVFDAAVLDFLVMGYTEYTELWEQLEQQSMTVANITDAATITGTSANDYIYGTENDDYLIGLEGNDYIYAYGGDDIIEGGAGNDIIYGYAGLDIYLHSSGDGNDHINSGETLSSDRVLMHDAEGNLLTAEELMWEVSTYDLKVTNRATGETITLDNMYYSTGRTFATVNGIDITGALNFVGTDANDYIYGTAHNDTLEGGLGNDIIYGKDGDDIYLHTAGEGNDHLYSGEALSADRVLMHDAEGNLLTEEELMWEVSTYDLKVTNRATGETITLDNMYYSTGDTFATVNDIDITGGLNFVATDANDVVHGTTNDDTLEGGLGNDIIYGKAGMDTFIHEAGDGNDHYYSGEYGGNDVVLAYDENGALLEEEDIIWQVSTYDLKVTSRATGETITLDNMYYSTGDTFSTFNGIDITGGLNFVATDGNDVVYGTANNDTLEGGVGNDIIYSKGSDDVFIHRLGDGDDHYYSNEFNSLDTILMLDGNGNQYAESELSFTQSVYDLTVTHIASGETITLDNMYYSTGNTFNTLNGFDLSEVV